MKPRSSNLKTLYEYEQCKDSDIVYELNELASSNEELYKFMEITSTYVKFRHYTGFIPTKNYRIQVLPKISKLDMDEKNSRDNLIGILLYIFSPPEVSIPKVEINDDAELDMLDLIIRMYAITLEEQILQGAYRKYIRFSEESKFLRGKLNVAKQIRKIDHSKFSINDFRFSMDNDLNRFFAHANRNFMRLTHDSTNANLLAWIDGILHDEDISPWSGCKINFNRLNERFRTPYIYARMILDNLIMMSGGPRDNITMIFNMNMVFENFFAKFINKNKETIFSNMSPKIEIQCRSNNFIYNYNVDDIKKSLRFTKPDVILSLDNYTYIFDTKYKKLNDPRIDRIKVKTDKAHSIASSDLYQMYTYSQVYNAKHTVLVFPGYESRLSDSYVFTLKDKEKKLWIYMLKLNFNSGKWEGDLVDEFKKNFMKIIKVDHQNNCTFL